MAEIRAARLFIESLKATFSNDEALILTEIKVPTLQTVSSIDAVVIHNTLGLYTVEIKGYSSLTTNDARFFTTRTSRGEVITVNDPFAQAKEQASALRKYIQTSLDISAISIVPVVAFPNLTRNAWERLAKTQMGSNNVILQEDLTAESLRVQFASMSSPSRPQYFSSDNLLIERIQQLLLAPDTVFTDPYSREDYPKSPYWRQEHDTSVFISYRRADTAWESGRLYERLNAEPELKDSIFWDVGVIEPGEKWREVINAAIKKSVIVLVVIGPKWLSVKDGSGHRRIDLPDDVLVHEIFTALDSGKALIPILIDETSMPSSQLLPDLIKDLPEYQFMRLTADSFKMQTENLISRIKNLLKLANST